MRSTPLFAALSLCAGWVASGVNADACPTATEGFNTVTVPGGTSVNVEWHSELAVDAIVYWMNFEGEESAAMVLPAQMEATGGSFPGHAFRVRTYNDELVMEFRVPAEGSGPHNVAVLPCGDTDKDPALYPEGKEVEFEALVHDQQAPCTGPSKEWSCIRRLSVNEWRRRGREGYGFLSNETTPDRVGLQTDGGYVQQIPLVPKVGSFGPGYVKMSMPKAMKDALLPWFAATKHAQEEHEPIPGGYTNVDKVPMSKLNLDHHPNVRMVIIKEMQQVMQWWTQMRVRHTSTYGVRIYKRGSMLINHVDRVDTHLASAVLQVDQDVDEDGGWPLEVLLGNKTVGEVYLQPGEMVLYEGAWLRHGRPMRFKGEWFANIFTHFSPYEWNGPGRHSPDTTQPLPHMFHGYEEGRCDTIADLPGLRSACTVTDAMETEWKAERAALGGHDEL